MSFESRWMIVGHLKTQAPLHIGNGGATTRERMFVETFDNSNNKSKEFIEIASICIDQANRPYIPGSTVKGNLRALAARVQSPFLDELFGSPDPELKSSVGGKAEFHDSCAINPPQTFLQDPPYWDPTRQTGVAAAVTLDRITKTASEKRLFHEEFVPPGVIFEVVITGQDLSDDEISELLWLLNCFNDAGSRLGASVGNGYGTMHWELVDLKRIVRDEVTNWIASGSPTTGYGTLSSIASFDKQKLIVKAANLRQSPPRLNKVVFAVRLDFLSNFLVNDPSRTGAVEESKAGHTPLLTPDGSPILPASSIRGAFRAQAEKILRTIGDEWSACYLNNNGRRLACRLEEIHESVIDKIMHLCPACLFFGCTSWKSIIEFTDFISPTPVREADLILQEFVAIDRFTGGGAEKKKFNAKSVEKPSLHGKISIDLDRFPLIASNGWPFGLLAFVMRDLMEGDVRFGLGAAKGYGEARLAIEGMSLPAWDTCPESLRETFSPEQWASLDTTSVRQESVKQVLIQWTKDLRTQVHAEKRQS